MKATSFTRGDFDGLADEVRQQGYCVLRQALSQQTIHEWKSAFDNLVTRRKNIRNGLAPRGDGRFYVTLPWVPPFSDRNVFANEAFHEVMRRIFPQEYQMVQLAADTPVKGSDYQPVHRDFRPLFSEELVTPLYALAVNFPLVEVTEDRGPVQVVPGSHLIARDEALRKLQSGELALQSVLMKPGDVMIRSPFALHRGTPNRTDEARPMIVMGWVMHWLHEPKVDLRIPSREYEAMPEELRRLLRCEIVDRADDENRPERYLEFAY